MNEQERVARWLRERFPLSRSEAESEAKDLLTSLVGDDALEFIHRRCGEREVHEPHACDGMPCGDWRESA